MAGSPVATRSRIMGLRTPIFVLLLLLLSGQLLPTAQTTDAGSGAGEGADAAGTPPPAQTIQPTRESIYMHLASELQAALGAEQHIKSVLTAAADGMKKFATGTVVPSLQAMVDTVLQKAEDTWVAADDAGKTKPVKPCVDGAEYDAQQVAKRALEKVDGCIKAVEEEAERRVRQAARLLSAIEDVSKRFVTTLEACIKGEEAKGEAQLPDAPAPDTEVAVPAEEPPAKCPKTPDAAPQEAVVAGDEKPARCPHAKDSTAKDSANAPQEAVEEEDSAAGQKKKPCPKCNKSQSEASKEEATEENEANVSEEAENAENAEEKVGKHGKEYKGKKGKEWKDNKAKDKTGKEKKEANVAENVELKDSEKNKEKGKHKKGKDGESKKGKHTESQEEGSQATENEGNANTEQNSGEAKDKKAKKSGKKEGKGKKDKGGESGEEKKSRKKRDLTSFDETPEEAAQPASDNAQEPSEGLSSRAHSPWPTEGSTPEERRVIACLSSASLQPLIEEKTRAYQRLQGVLQRTAEKEKEAPTCVTDHVHKAELKINAIKQRMASCAERKMRQEL